MHDAECFAWPGYLEKNRVPEEAFAEAYAAVSDVERSWIKKNIAQLYAFHSPNGREQTRNASRWSAGFQSIVHLRPKDWAILILAGKSASPCRLVAALLPALTHGVGNILAVLLDKADPKPLQLVALELCGLDMVCALNRRQIKNLLAFLEQSRTRGAVLDPDHLLPESCLPENWRDAMALWRPAALRRMGLWTETSDQWDWQALAWNHPGMTIDVWGKPPKKLPQGFALVRGDQGAFFNAGYQVLGVPLPFLAKCPSPGCDFMLTPGQEGCWLWPDLHREIFLTRAVCLGDSPDNARLSTQTPYPDA